MKRLLKKQLAESKHESHLFPGNKLEQCLIAVWDNEAKAQLNADLPVLLPH